MQSQHYLQNCINYDGGSYYYKDKLSLPQEQNASAGGMSTKNEV